MTVKEDTADDAPTRDVFDLPPRPSTEALRRWRKATLALNAVRRFRYTRDLSLAGNESGTESTSRSLRAISRSKDAGSRSSSREGIIVDAAEKGPALRQGAHFGLTAEDLVDLQYRADPNDLVALGGVEGVAKALRSSVENGLDESEEEKEKRVVAFGSNTYPKKPGKSIFNFLWDACQDRTLQILMVCSVVSLIAGMSNPDEEHGPKKGWYEGVGIGFAVILCVVVTTFSDWRQAKQFQNLTDENNNIQLQVVRGGRRIRISIYDIMVGDVVPLAIGDQVPGDGIFLNGHSLTIDESSMTGESDPMHKDSKHPYLLSGCKVVDGFGNFMVTNVGVNTEWGKVMATLSEDNTEETPLQVRLNGAATMIGTIGCVVAAFVLVVLLIRYFVGESQKVFSKKNKVAKTVGDITSIFAVAVTIIVVSVPEGLPLAVTLTLAYSMRKMMIDKALVRHLAACETMGSATAICSDKTGTLTLNQMTVVEAWVAGEKRSVSETTLDASVSKILLEGVALNTTTSVFIPESGEPEVTGSPTEAAIVSWALKLGMDFAGERAAAKTLHVEAFNSAKKRAGVIVKSADGIVRIHWKGASEIVLGMCDTWIDATGATHPLSLDKKNELLETIQKMAESSLRTICLAYRTYDEKLVPAEGGFEGWNMPASGLTCIAIVGIKDPCRPGVAEAVARCQAAGVRVRMVTGDNAVTAEAIAKECGIMTGDGIVIEGQAFRVLSPEQMREIIPKINVMARSSPTDKHTLVKMLRSMGEVVGVTGDGTNDAPALHEADIGLAMGIAGTEVAKESADIVILDDNFASIVRVVRWGRSVYSNIQKFLQFQLTVNVVALSLNFTIAVFTKNKVPLTAVQLLWVNMIMDTLGALALATMAPTDELLERKPVGRRDPIITNVMWRNIFGQAIYQLILLMVLEFKGKEIFGLKGSKAGDVNRTMIFNTFVFCQVFNEINSRNMEKINVFEGFFSNPMFLSIIIITCIFQFLIVTFLTKFASTVPLNWQQWLICIGLGFVSMPIAVVLKCIPVPQKPIFEGVHFPCFSSRVKKEKSLLEGDDLPEGGGDAPKVGNGKPGHDEAANV